MSQQTVANESWYGMYRAEREHPIKGGHSLKLDLKSGCFDKAVVVELRATNRGGSQLETRQKEQKDLFC